MKNLKKIALSLLVVGLAVGFSAFRNVESKQQNTYYPVKVGSTNNFTWKQIDPDDYRCESGAAGCSGYSAASAPAANTIPSGYTSTNQVRVPL